MSNHLSPAQVRGARAMLGWSMLTLATAARISVSTVKRTEGALPRSGSDDVHEAIRAALEMEGLQFLPDDGNGPGMRLRPR